MVDRYSAYKAMAQVKLGTVVLAFCWAHVRRDFVTVGKSGPEHKEWALAWLRRIRALYRHDRGRRHAQAGSGAFTAADMELRHLVATMQAQVDAELADPKLPTPCRKVLESLQEHWDGLTRFLDDPRIPLDNNASERQVRGQGLRISLGCLGALGNCDSPLLSSPAGRVSDGFCSIDHLEISTSSGMSTRGPSAQTRPP